MRNFTIFHFRKLNLDNNPSISSIILQRYIANCGTFGTLALRSPFEIKNIPNERQPNALVTFLVLVIRTEQRKNGPFVRCSMTCSLLVRRANVVAKTQPPLVTCSKKALRKLIKESRPRAGRWRCCTSARRLVTLDYV